MTRRRRLTTQAVVALALGALAALGRVARAQTISVTSDVTPKVGTMADRYVFTVEIAVTGISGYDRFNPPKFNDWSIADVSTRQSTQWLYDPARGQEIKNVEVRRYTLVPRRAGKLKIEEALVRIGKDDHLTKPLVVDVDSSGQPTLPSPGASPSPGSVQLPPTANPDLFIEGSVDKKKVVVGEQVVVSWKLFVAGGELSQWMPTQEPTADGFWVEDLTRPTHFTYTEETRNGKHYTSTTILTRALFPLRAGELRVGSLGGRAEVFGGPASGNEEVRSAPIVLEVAPAPALGRPPGFEPPNVGKFSIKASADPTSVQGGDPIMLTVDIEGQGNVRGLKIPMLLELSKVLPKFRVFQPKIDESVAIDDDVIGGKRSYVFRLQPLSDGEFEIPPLELAYFDPEAHEYQVAKTTAIPVAISGVPATPATPGNPDDANKNIIDAPRIHGQVYGSTLTSRKRSRFHQQPMFWLLLVLPPLCLLGVVAFDRVRARMLRETPRTRLRRAASRARKTLRLCELHIKGERPVKFFAELSRALTDHLEDRLGIPVAGMTRDELRRVLSDRGMPEETLAQLARELENCDFARFAPSASGPGEMRAALRRGKTLLGEIERAPLKSEKDLKGDGDASGEAA